MQLKDVGLTTQEVMDMTKKYMIETYERFPLVAVKAKDYKMWDSEGNEWLDMIAGIAVCNAGNCNDKVVAAIQEQASQIMHTFNYPYSIPQAVLAKFICEHIGFDKIFYQNSGAEANEAMIKLARKYGVDKYGPERYHIVTAKMGFHGRTYGAMAATGQPDNACQVGFKPMVPGFTYAEYNNLDSFKAAVTDNTIAIMVEPIQGEGGVIPAKPEFLKGLRQLCDEKGMLLCFDEVQTGWGRTGYLMAYMGYGVKPDIVSMAKGMGGGVAIGAICTTDKVAAAFTPGSHGSTFGGSILNCAASYAEVTEIVKRNLPMNSLHVGAYLQEQLKTLPHVKDVRGRGLMIGIEFDAPKGHDIKFACVARHMLSTLIGTSVIRLIPPLTIDREVCDRAVAIMRDAVNEVYGD